MNLGSILILFIIVYCLFRIHFFVDLTKHSFYEKIVKYSLTFLFLILLLVWIFLFFESEKKNYVQQGGGEKIKRMNDRFIQILKGRKINMFFQLLFGISLFTVLSFTECYSTLLIFFVFLIIYIYLHKRNELKHSIFTKFQLMEDGNMNHSKFAITDIFGIFVTQYISDENSRSIVDYTILYMLVGITIIRLYVLRSAEKGEPNPANNNNRKERKEKRRQKNKKVYKNRKKKGWW